MISRLDAPPPPLRVEEGKVSKESGGPIRGARGEERIPGTQESVNMQRGDVQNKAKWLVGGEYLGNEF